MNEVASETAALLVDALTRRGIDVDALWAGLDVRRDGFNTRGTRLDWDVWVEMLQRAETAVGGPESTPNLFVPGAGARTGHSFVRVANAFVSLTGLYALFARWGLNRTLTVVQASFEPRGAGRARFTVSIDPNRAGSQPTFRFIIGILRHLPGLQGLGEAKVTMRPGATDHFVEYDVLLPPQGSLLKRARRMVNVWGGAAAALDQLEAQAAEIGLKHAQLEEQFATLARTTASLREREEWLELALEAGNVGIWRMDAETRAIRCTLGVPRLLGLPESDTIQADDWIGRIHADDRPHVMKYTQESLDRGAAIDVEYRLVRTSKDVAWVRVKGRALHDGSGRRTHVFGTIADVTEQKSLETRLRFADRMIAAGALAAGVAHEINNPLTYMIGNVEILRAALPDGVDPSALRASIDEIADGVTRIRDIVRDLRTFSRPDEDHVRAVELSGICDAAIRLVSAAVRHRARVETSYDPSTPRVLANESRLGQVVINLLLNASQAMPARAATENVILVRTLARGNDAVIEIEDNGVGIAPDAVARVFDPFFTTKPIGAGTGLGLSVCQSIVTALKGRIDVETEVGRGSIFRVVLPATQEPGRDTSIAASAVTVEPERALPDRIRVLVIDDEPLVRRSLAQLLESRGIDVREAEGGRRGIEIAADESFDAILCDLMMPGIDGVGVHEEISRTRPALAQSMVFMSGGAVTERAQAFAERPGVVVLHKPFETARLLETLQTVARRQR